MVQLGPPPLYEPVFVPMKPGHGSVPPTPRGNAPFDWNQPNLQHEIQTLYEEQTLSQGFGSDQGIHQEMNPNVQPDSSSDSDASDDVDMFLQNPKLTKKMDKFLNKVFKMFPQNYLNMMSNVTSSSEQVNVQKQQGGELLSFSLHPNEENAQQATQPTLMSKRASKALTVAIPQKSPFETINNPLFNTTPVTQDQIKTTQILTTIPQQEVISSMHKIGSKSKMQESFTTGMPDITNVQNNSTMQQSSYIPLSSIYFPNTIVTNPVIMATQRTTDSGLHRQQLLQQLSNIQKVQSNVQTSNVQQQQFHIRQQIAAPSAPLQVNANLQPSQWIGQTTQQVNASAIPHLKEKQQKPPKQSFLQMMGYTPRKQLAQSQQMSVRQHQQQHVPQYVPRQTSYHTSQPQLAPMQYQQHTQLQYQPRLQEAQQQGRYQGMAQPQQQVMYQEHYMPETPKTAIFEYQQLIENTMY